jgi:Omptin family
MSRAACILLAGTALVAASGSVLAGGIDEAALRGSAYDPPAPSYRMAYAGDTDPIGLRTTTAPDFAPQPAPAEHKFEVEVGGRYWYSTGKLAKNLYDIPGGNQSLLSRLTYSGLTSNTGEGFARIDIDNGFFIKGYAGLGNLGKGSLNDEDFPPGIDPYSSTLSDQRGGKLSYLTADLGYRIVDGPNYRVGAFVGYHYLAEQVNAYGCNQVATNPFVCVPTIDGTVLGISEDAKWNAGRVGLAGDIGITSRLKLSVEAAWLPYVKLTSADTHWLRLGPGGFSGPIPESGTGTGAQFDASLSYCLTEALTVGVGARYWHMEAKGNASFDLVIPGALPQPINFTTDRLGAYVQGAYRFGVL